MLTADGVLCVINGREVIRDVSRVEVERFGNRGVSRIIPCITSGEEIVWIVGDARPHILTVKERSA